VTGPYETEREARGASLWVIRDKGTGYDMAMSNLDDLTHAATDAGVVLGAYDRRILEWLAQYEPATCAVIAGLITRAYAAGTADPKNVRGRVADLEHRSQAEAEGLTGMHWDNLGSGS
jgi:hypothetical protein